MRAVGVTTPGGPEVLEIIRVPEPANRSGCVRVRVLAAAVNPTDIALRELGSQGFVSGEPPWIPGMDASGVVLDPGDSGLGEGEHVIALAVPFRRWPGAQSEIIVLPAESVVPAPRGFSVAESAALPMNAMTAHMALAILDLTPGSVLGVTGGAGYLASFVIALGRHRGLVVVADAAPEDAQLVREFGAHHIVSRGPQMAAEIRSIIPDGVDAIVDAAVLGATVLAAVRDGGRIVAVRAFEGDLERGITAQMILVGEYARNHDALLEVVELAEAGVLRSRIARVVDVADVAEAHRITEAGGLRGRVVLAFDQSVLEEESS